MKHKMLRLLIIIGVAVTTTGVLLGFNLIYNKFVFTDPLEASVKSMPAVGNFQVEKQSSQSIIKVQFKVEEKLRSSFYHLLDQLEAQSFTKSGKITLEVSNDPDEYLNKFLLAARLPVQEALSTGQFTALPAALKVLAEENLVKYDLEVDNSFIFLTATKDEQTAHLIINRGSSPLTIINTMGGEYL